MKPNVTYLSDYAWLMLDDGYLNELPLNVLHSEPLSLHLPTINQNTKTLPTRFNHLVV